MPELIHPGVDGFLEKVGDVESHAVRIIEVLRDEEKYGAMSRAARRKAETQFDTTKVIPEYEAYYEEILGG